jgi:hypothetical protein
VAIDEDLEDVDADEAGGHLWVERRSQGAAICREKERQGVAATSSA